MEPTTTSLSVYDRATLGGVLPQGVGSFREMLAVDDLRKRIALSDEEKEKISFKQYENGAVGWNPKAAEEIGDTDYTFTEEEHRLIGLGFVLMERGGTVPTEAPFIGLYRKFQTDIEAAQTNKADAS